jgi:mannose-6-phosphate isomerase-like protein (cupin superfamily)
MMENDRRFCIHEGDVESFRVAREGSGGYLTVRRLFDPEVSGTEQGIVLIADVPAHQAEGITPHFHREYEETMYVAAGRGLFRVGRSPDTMRAIPVRPGSCCYVPVDFYHELQVEGDEAMKLVISYFCTSGDGGKSHRQIALELTNVSFQGTYGES